MSSSGEAALAWYGAAMADRTRPADEGEGAALDALMERYIAGDIAAFDELYARTAPRVFAFLLAMARDRQCAEDLCQAVYLKLHRARRDFLRGSPLMPYLMAIARNAFLDDSRHRKRALVRLTATGELPEPATTPSMSAVVGLKDAFERAVAALSPPQREAYVLIEHSGLSLAEAAQVLDATEMAVKLRVHRANEALRAALEPFRGDDS